MNRVDHMIKYLSGDLDREESTAFEKDLAQDKQLRDAFVQVSAAYKLVETQLTLRDESAFRAALSKAMDQSEPGESPGPENRRSRWILLASAAASVAILMTIFIMNRDPGRIYLAFFHPAEDPVVLAYNQETRGDSDSAITLFSQGQFEASLKKTSDILQEEPGNQMALLFHLLAAMELNLEADVLARMESVELDTSHSLGQSITWYYCLSLLKSGHKDEAEAVLERLLSQPGPYESDAHKLQKMLTK